MTTTDASLLWESAPGEKLSTGAIQGVHLRHDETVTWTWDSTGKTVIAYTIRRKDVADDS